MIRLIIILVLFSNSALSQTYLGKKLTITVGSQFFPSKSKSFVVDEDAYSTIRSSIFPLKLELDSRYMLTSNLSVGLNMNYHGLKNATYIIRKGGQTSDYYYSFIDNFQLVTNSWSIGCDFLIFHEYGPIGNHFILGVGYTSATTTVYSTLNHEIDYPSTFEGDFTYKLDSWKVKSNFVHATFGYGTTRLISKRFLIEYGVKSSIFFALDKKTPGEYPISDVVNPNDYQLQTKSYTRRVTLKNLRSTNLISVYVKFGLGL